MERVLARHEEKPLVLKKSQLSVKMISEYEYDDMEKSSVANESLNPDHQPSKPTTQQLHMAVDPDVMEYITTTSHHHELKKALAAKNCEINWTQKNKTAVIVFRGKDESGAWQSECLEVVQRYLGNFSKRDVEAKKEFWDTVKTQLSNIRAYLGIDPPLIKSVDESFCLRVVSKSSEAKVFEVQLNAKLNEIYREETKKTYLKFTKSISEERLTLLKKIKFAEQLQQHNKELEIKLDTEKSEIYFEGPQKQFEEAVMKFNKLDENIVEKKLSESKSILEVLGSNEGLQRMKCELENNKIDAVYVIDNDARIVGTSATQVDKAASLVGELTLEEKVRVDETSQHLLKTPEWRQMCDELNTGDVIRVYQNIWNSTFVAGFRQDVQEAKKKLTAFLEKNRVCQERFKCSSELIRRYLLECRQDYLCLIEIQLASFEVKIENGKGEDEFTISGTKEGLDCAREKLQSFVARVSSKTVEVKQPGLRKFYASGKGDRLEKSIEKNRGCVIHVEKSFDTDQVSDPGAEEALESDAQTSSDKFDEPAINEIDVPRTDRPALVTAAGHRISGRRGLLMRKIVDTLASKHGACSPSGFSYQSFSGYAGPSTEVIIGDMTKETSDAIVNLISSDMNMNNAGVLSKAILREGGRQIQDECSRLGQQTAGSAVMTTGGNLAASRVIHIIPGSSNKHDLQTCLEAGLRLADSHGLHSLSIPCVGTGVYGLTAADSARITFQALDNFSLGCQSVNKVRVVVFLASMMQDFLQAQQSYAARKASVSLKSESSSKHAVVTQSGQQDTRLSVTKADPSVNIRVAGPSATSVEKAVDALKLGFSEACTTEKVENESVSQLSQKQIDFLRKKANARDVRLDVEVEVDRIVVRGEPTEVTGMVGEIWQEINERNKKIKEEQQGRLVSENIEWSYEAQGVRMVFDSKTSTKLEMANVKGETSVRVSLRADEFDINLKLKTGKGRKNWETITIHRKVKGTQEGIPLPKHWNPMPQRHVTVHLVQLAPGSSEYQDVVRKLQSTARGINVQKIERVQNPLLYQSYLVRKQKMDQDHPGGNNERQLFHGTQHSNIKRINTQGFNRSFCGVHGVKFGQGVYFARDASYSVHYASGSGSRYMYLARVLVGQYCLGNSSMIVPPPKHSSRPEILYDSVVDNMSNPSIFVVFYDSQCYPEYLISFY